MPTIYSELYDYFHRPDTMTSQKCQEIKFQIISYFRAEINNYVNYFYPFFKEIDYNKEIIFKERINNSYTFIGNIRYGLLHPYSDIICDNRLVRLSVIINSKNEFFIHIVFLTIINDEKIINMEATFTFSDLLKDELDFFTNLVLFLVGNIDDLQINNSKEIIKNLIN